MNTIPSFVKVLIVGEHEDVPAWINVSTIARFEKGSETSVKMKLRVSASYENWVWIRTGLPSFVEAVAKAQERVVYTSEGY